MCQLGKNASGRPLGLAGEEQEQGCPACGNINRKAMMARQNFLGEMCDVLEDL